MDSKQSALKRRQKHQQLRNFLLRLFSDNMNNPALAIVEEVYSIALNPTEDYFAQLQSLAHGGELANNTSVKQVLFKLCMLFDSQNKEIQSLKERLEVNNATITQKPKL